MSKINFRNLKLKSHGEYLIQEQNSWVKVSFKKAINCWDTL